MTQMVEQRLLARQMRMRVIEISHRSRSAHLGSALSCIDILVAAYFGGLRLDPSRPDDPGRDRLILSKGHAAMALYSVLARRGYFPDGLLDDYGAAGGRFQEHPAFGVPGVDMATGSLGHGLPVASGMALAGRLQGRDYRVCVVMSDGECNEGTVWEAALFAASMKLGNILAFVDYNKWQATGRSDEILGLPNLRDKWLAFGWDVCEIDGHDWEALLAVFARPFEQTGNPRMIVAHTVKGSGVSFMEDDNNWHYRVPNEEEVARARRELVGG